MLQERSELPHWRTAAATASKHPVIMTVSSGEATQVHGLHTVPEGSRATVDAID